MHAITTVLFDLGGVVARFQPAVRLAAFADATGLPAATIQSALWDSGFSADCDRGHYTTASMCAEIRDRLGVQLTDADIVSRWVTAFVADDAVLVVVNACAAAGKRTGLFTNNSPLLYDAMPVYFPAVAGRFDPLLFSCDLQSCKPEPAIFRTAEARLQVTAEQILLIDDSLTNVTAAQAVGWHALHFRDVPALWADLREMGRVVL